MVTGCDAPAPIVPLVKLAAYEVPLPLGTVRPVIVSGPFPEFVMVSVALAL